VQWRILTEYNLFWKIFQLLCSLMSICYSPNHFRILFTLICIVLNLYNRNKCFKSVKWKCWRSMYQRYNIENW
jgi:hypothetical protein